MRLKTWVLYLVLAGTAMSAIAQDPSDKKWPEIDKYFSPEEVEKMTEEKAKQNLQQVSTQQSQQRGAALADFKRGAGLGITVAPEGDDRIDEASVVNNRIAITKENTSAARLMFEFHQLFTTNIFTGGGRAAAREQLRACEADSINCPMFGIGPFIALQMSDDDAIASVGAGIMLGVRNDPRKDTSFNIGIGVQWDSNAKRLAAGFSEGEPLPTGETQIRFKEEGKARLMIGLSLGF